MLTPLPRVLLVDDDESICFALRDYFATEGYDVSAARDLNEADALLARQPYEIVIVDLRLGPSKQTLGMELVSRVRTLYPTTAVVLFTAHGTPEIARETRRLGATFLEKPLPLPALRSVIDRLRPSKTALDSN